MSFIVEKEIAGKTLKIETGKMARLAAGSVTVQYGETIVLATVATKELDSNPGFLPLLVEYKEKSASVGKIPGGFFKREGRPTTKEILTMRLVDRSIRPLFHKTMCSEIQVIALVLSADQENDPDIIAMIAATSAIAVAGLPFNGPVGSVRVGRIDGQFILNPTLEQLKESDINLVVSGTYDAINMVEAGANEVDESVMTQAILWAHEQIRVIIGMQKELMQKCNVSFPEEQEPEVNEEETNYYNILQKKYAANLEKSVQIHAKQERSLALKELLSQIKLDLVGEEESDENKEKEKLVKNAYQKLTKDIVRRLITQGKRVDGRGLKDIRNITSEVGLIPRTHGSALFTRGETQSLVNVTLGTSSDKQVIDGLHPEYHKRFILHYNFPPFCVGEVGFMRGPGRREIGHGALAERALEAVIPDNERFPYTIRVVSDILESNGSSSMASVCGGTLSMMDAGVPIKKPVGGIAMGLVKEDDNFYILSDILGLEDHLGDMDFKVAGTQRGITALQMDIKITGIDRQILEQALSQAREGRIHILREMMKALSRPRKEISKYAPRVVRMEIDPEKIALVIGPGGKNIRSIQETTGAKVDVENDGVITVYCIKKEGALKAKEMIETLTEDLKVGKIYEGKVTSIKDFGAFVEIAPGLEGLVHVSELENSFVQNVNDSVKVGDKISVKVLAIDDQNRVKLSKRAVDGPSSESEEETNEEDVPQKSTHSNDSEGTKRKHRNHKNHKKNYNRHKRNRHHKR
ncbi:polyribonucleotide nucleotidyltransferase [Candidatus Uabimicrobium amorphum]|uniref:Polyribonucleotide nucleotidyltransferase n=1 Tax=Uabimicrobium amorphum TaxID=2596890 RepID=A0A5S9F3K9_UABAM|nr:polyribonucleotide nucleotidyltransferase [Candidatus Uabimicrobium amorphum]BBM84845.1 polyribonucleotide nucleotidyltransferase [Candidatus Uabimicrobium amorphum]